MQNLITALNTRMNKVKRALGLPESIGLFGIVQACPILVFFGLLDVTPFVGPGLMRVGGCGHAAAPC